MAFMSGILFYNQTLCYFLPVNEIFESAFPSLYFADQYHFPLSCLAFNCQDELVYSQTFGCRCSLRMLSRATPFFDITQGYLRLLLLQVFNVTIMSVSSAVVFTDTTASTLTRHSAKTVKDINLKLFDWVNCLNGLQISKKKSQEIKIVVPKSDV